MVAARDPGGYENKLSGALRVLLAQLQLEMRYLQGQIEESDKLILRIAGDLEACRRLVAIPGIGPLTATATVAAIGNGAAFKKGRGVPHGLAILQLYRLGRDARPLKKLTTLSGPAGLRSESDDSAPHFSLRPVAPSCRPASRAARPKSLDKSSPVGYSWSEVS